MNWQTCPKCNGQGFVSRPPNIPGDINQWTSSDIVHKCNMCFGEMKLLVPDVYVDVNQQAKEDEINKLKRELTEHKHLIYDMARYLSHRGNRCDAGYLNKCYCDLNDLIDKNVWITELEKGY